MRVYVVHVLGCLLLLFPGCSRGFLMANSPRKVNQILTVRNGGPWGDWHIEEWCPTGTFVNGFSFKIEGDQGKGDDTSLNGVKLHCGFIDQSGFGGDVTSGVGPWGGWTTTDWYCPKPGGMSQFLTSFRMKVEPDQGGGDDTAVNYFQFKCKDFGSSIGGSVLPQGGGSWGSYGGWSASCPRYSAICGIQTKVEISVGGADDTALNDARLFCCSE